MRSVLGFSGARDPECNNAGYKHNQKHWVKSGLILFTLKPA